MHYKDPAIFETLLIFFDAIFKQEETAVVCVTGQAGAGKTTLGKALEDAAEHRGRQYLNVPLDWFFIKSSKQRAAWLAEEGIDNLERARRADQINWWDFDLANKTLVDLKAGDPVHLYGVYDRSRGGELVLDVDLPALPRPSLIVLEGVAGLHIPSVDTSVFLHMPAKTRFQRLLQRDTNRRGQAAIDRWDLTQRFETRYFREHWDKIGLFATSNRNGLNLLERLEQDDSLADYHPSLEEAMLP